MKFQVFNRWTGNVQFTAEIECAEDLSPRLKMGLAVRWAILRGANLRDADLSDADLSDADLSDANLSGVPVIKNIHQSVFSAASKAGALNMSEWHKDGNVCGTTHCRAGWVVALAGEGGRALEWAMGTPAAAAMIYLASDPKIEKIPNFYCDNESALADMKRLAELDADEVQA